MPQRSASEDRATIGRRDLLLLLLGSQKGAVSAEGIGGITRLQKLLFLLDKEEHVSPAGEGFVFQPYKAGPYSPKLYDDLEFLENLDLISKRVAGEGTEAEAAEIELTFEDFIEPEIEPDDFGGPTADEYGEYRYSLTPKGVKKVKELLAKNEYRSVAESVSRVKGRYGRYALQDLLYYVYTQYPNYTTESEIKEQVLRRRR